MSSGTENIKRSFEEKGKWSLEQSMSLGRVGGSGDRKRKAKRTKREGGSVEGYMKKILRVR